MYVCVFLKKLMFVSSISDIDVDKPDKKLVIMYLTSLYHGLREYSPQGGRKRRKLDVSAFPSTAILLSFCNVIPRGT